MDLGCGNGHLLLELNSFGYTNLLGVDYSQAAIDLAHKIAEKRSQNVIKFQQMDLFADSNVGEFMVVLDKGTFDAVTLDPRNDDWEKKHGRNLGDEYVLRVGKMLKEDGVLLISSCNWTRDELLERFCSGNLLILFYSSFYAGRRVGIQEI